MRILFISNFYPPARPGGYTQWCHEVAQSLEARGHSIGVLTSRHELEKIAPGERDIYRRLHLDGDLTYYRPIHFFTRWRQQHRENLATLRQVVANFEPELIFVWGMWAMSPAIPALAEALLPGRVVYFLSDYWPAAVNMHTAYWRLPTRHWFTRWPKQILSNIALSMLDKEGQPVLKLEHVITVSAAVRDILVEAGLPLAGARVIHGGTDVARFPAVGEREYLPGRLRLVYAGQLVQHKGVHTAVQAMAILVNERGIKGAHLTLVGSGPAVYETALRALVDREGLGDYVTFHGAAAKEDMPAILRDSDVLIFPSIYEEPFARMTQEAMLAGLAVIGTTTGGTKEILAEGENGLTFAAEDGAGLARQIARLVNDYELCARLAEAGRQTVLENYTLDKMVDKIEAYLYEVAAIADERMIMSAG